jgi:Flp pilus assembly pilin Flp
MTTTLRRLWADEDAQDLIEYTLLLAFVTLAAATLLTKAGSSVNTVWTAANTTLTNAVARAS